MALQAKHYDNTIFHILKQSYVNKQIKKEIALREEKEAALLKAKKQRLSKNSEKKDIN